MKKPLVPILEAMEGTGVLIDARLLESQSEEIAAKLAVLERQRMPLRDKSSTWARPSSFRKYCSRNSNYPSFRKTPKGQPSTAEDVLQELADDYELPRLILEHRSLSKLKSTYTDRLPEQICARPDACIPPIIRLSPQRVGYRLRLPTCRIFRYALKKVDGSGRHLSPRGYGLLAADYSQIELRIMAHLSGDKGLLEAFAADRDIHQATAAEVFAHALDEVTDRSAAFGESHQFRVHIWHVSFWTGQATQHRPA